MTPKYSPILCWPQENIHKSFHTPKNIHFSEPPAPKKIKKILKFKILNPQKWPDPTYVWKDQSTPLGSGSQTNILVLLLSSAAIWDSQKIAKIY